MVFIIAEEQAGGAGARLRDRLVSKGIQAEYAALENVEVQPCRNCGYCSKKNPGLCAFRDDGDWIYPKIAAADAVVVVTPVVFGGYSFKVKRVLDKLGLIMDTHYAVRRGELVKGGLPGRRFKLFAVGVGPLMDGEGEVFSTLVHETIRIVQGLGGAFLAGPEADERLLDEIASEVANA
jgi:hypothetical protein